MMDEKTIVFVGGYARVGKTTLFTQLRASGYYAIETGDILYEFIDSLGDLLGLSEFGAYLKRYKANPLRLTILNTTSEARTGRNWIIGFAEEVLVKVFGRGLFPKTAIDRALNNENSEVFISVLNPEELNAGLEYLAQISPGTRYKLINIMCLDALPDVDSRQLIPNASTFFNKKENGRMCEYFLAEVKYAERYIVTKSDHLDPVS